MVSAPPAVVILLVVCCCVFVAALFLLIGAGSTLSYLNQQRNIAGTAASKDLISVDQWQTRLVVFCAVMLALSIAGIVGSAVYISGAAQNRYKSWVEIQKPGPSADDFTMVGK